jgi:rod shape-determining protein MreC
VHDSRRTRLVLGVLLVVALLLIVVDYRDGSSGPVGGMRRVASSVFGGAERGVSAVTGPVTRLFDGSTSGSDSSQVAALQAQVLRLRTQLNSAQLTKSDYAQLKRLLQLSGQGGYRIVAATVVAAGQGFQRTVTLDAGSADGVKARQTVLNSAGLVGQVTAVSAHTCTVLLATDASSVVGIRMAPSGQLGYVTGLGAADPGLLRLQVLDANLVLSKGEQLVTSASVNNRPFVAGVPVGLVEQVQNKAGSLTSIALVQPYADFSSLGVVGIVVRPPAHDPRFSVLPPKPSATPVPTVTVTVTPRPPGSPHVSPSPGG